MKSRLLHALARTLRLVMLILASLLMAMSSAGAAEITVFAAASLTDALKAAAAAYEKQHGDRIVFNFGASSMLARQIEEGAPADIFFSADEAKMDALEKSGLVLKGSRKSRLSNSLVIITAADGKITVNSPTDLARPEIKRIALADPKAVPAGVYARTYLERAGLWTRVQSKVVPTDNVRAALAAVESGNVEAGLVFKTDAAISKKVRVAYAIPREEGPDIRYSMAVVKDSKRIDTAKSFLQYLASDEAASVFEKYGFISLR